MKSIFLLCIFLVSVQCTNYWLYSYWQNFNCSGPPFEYIAWNADICIGVDDVSLSYTCDGSSIVETYFEDGDCAGASSESANLTLPCFGYLGESFSSLCVSSLPEGAYIYEISYAYDNCLDEQQLITGFLENTCIIVGEGNSESYGCNSGTVEVTSCANDKCTEECTTLAYKSQCEDGIGYTCGGGVPSSGSGSTVSSTTRRNDAASGKSLSMALVLLGFAFLMF